MDRWMCDYRDRQNNGWIDGSMNRRINSYGCIDICITGQNDGR